MIEPYASLKSEVLCGFAMETEDLLENSRKKLMTKNCDLICANNLKVEGAGFGTDTNQVILLLKNGEIVLELMSKDQVAHQILDTMGNI